MNLLHPWYLMGLAAVGLPVAVHLLTRPRPRVLPLSTIRFVREAVRQRRARHRLRDWIILILRGLAVALLAIAFARPLIGAKKLVTSEAGNAVRIVILDQSQSMAAVSNGVQSFERARTAAASHLAYAPGLQANLMLAGAKPRAIFPAPSSNFGAMREALAPASPRSEMLNLKAAIDAAGEMLARVPPDRRRELVVVSDFQRSNWVAADFSPLPKDTVIQLETVAASPTPANLAILRVAAQGRVEQGREARLEVDVGNFSATPRDVQVELSVAGASYRLNGHCSPGTTTTLSADAVLTTAGWQGGEARLVGAQDALSADDARSFVLDVRPPISYLLITRDPMAPHASAAHFLERALVPRKAVEGRRGERVVRADPDSLDREAVAAADVIVLDHPGRLSSESMKLLASVVRRGRAMLYVSAEPIDASNLALLADAAGSDLKMPAQFVPPAPGSPRQGLFIASSRTSQGIFRAFGENLGAALAPLRFGGGLDSRPLETGLADDVLATYSDRSAGLVVTSCGAGRLAILNADLGQSNLPASPVFVPLLGELVGRLLSRTGTADSVPGGELALSYLPPEVTSAQGLSIVGPGKSAESPGTLTEESGLVVWRWDEAGPPGVYQVKRAGETIFALATATPPQESDLTAIDPAVLTGRLAGGRTIHFQAAGGDEPRPETAWSWIITACVACMLVEVVALKAFRT
jgi:hypothetical protein